jgi:hypothetical protein
VPHYLHEGWGLVSAHTLDEAKARAKELQKRKSAQAKARARTKAKSSARGWSQWVDTKAMERRVREEASDEDAEWVRRKASGFRRSRRIW